VPFFHFIGIVGIVAVFLLVVKMRLTVGATISDRSAFKRQCMTVKRTDEKRTGNLFLNGLYNLLKKISNISLLLRDITTSTNSS
jgi:hypothetical protein